MYGEENGFCINNNAFNKLAEALINKEYYDTTYMAQDNVYERVFPTRECAEKLAEYINNVKQYEVDMERSLWEIINEEIMSYFAGEKSVDEYIDIIQNKAPIWISEQS